MVRAAIAVVPYNVTVMDAKTFIAKWKGCTLKERSASQEHFIDLCNLVGQETPAQADPHGEWFCFERGVTKTGGGDGWADVWRRRCFAWEYKGKHKDLNAAFVQLQRYAIALENPPLLVVSDMETIIIRTNFTNTVMETHTIALDEIGAPENQAKLRWLFAQPDKLRPGITTAEVTAEVASAFADLAKKLRGDPPYQNAPKHDPHRVAHFLNKLLFCLFAEDIDLLPEGLLTRLLENSKRNPDSLQRMLKSLFATMSTGGEFGVEVIDWFNGGLFDGDDVLPLDADDIARLITVARAKWNDISPSLFGTLFERGLDPSKRSQLGAHYTDPDSIMRIVEPVVIERLAAEWDERKKTIQAGIAAWEAKKDSLSKSVRDTATRKFKEAQTTYHTFLLRLRDYRVLDPACGSGNFLYLALQSLKNFGQRVMLDAENMGLERGFPEVGPQCVMGIEINDYAAELARVTIWIGEIQWMLRHGFNLAKNPVLKTLDQIACRDAVLNADGSEAEWPKCDAIIGNPPFLGAKRMRSDLGDDYTDQLRKCYEGRVPGEADLVTYWFEKARAHIVSGKAGAAGLVATNSIRQTGSRPVLERIGESGRIFHAWSDEPWVNEGANVRVSIVCFDAEKPGGAAVLDGKGVLAINADLTEGGASKSDLTKARRLAANAGRSFFGLLLAGKFAVNNDTAQRWLQDANPNGRSNSDVLRPILNGNDVLKNPSNRWVIDFGTNMTEADASLYAAPFAYLEQVVKPERITNREASRAKYWWRLGRSRPELRTALKPLQRYIATVETAKHRIFVWLPVSVAPEHRLIVIAREDDTTFGILSSRIHVAWALAQGGTLEDRPVYNSTQCFDTFPFPVGMEPDRSPTHFAANPHAIAIAAAAQDLVEKRQNVLKSGKTTLTSLYNERPTWLDDAHLRLDAAVAAAYGWADWGTGLPDDEILTLLLAENLSRPAVEDTGKKR